MITGLKNPNIALRRYQHIDEDETRDNEEGDDFEGAKLDEDDEEEKDDLMVEDDGLEE